jgi:hypothetical protein
MGWPLTLDSTPNAVKRASVEAFAGPIPSLVNFLTDWLPDPMDRKEIASEVIAEIGNPAYHLYSPMYVAISEVVLIVGILLLDANLVSRQWVCLDKDDK